MLWNLTGSSAVVLPRRLPNFRAAGQLQTRDLIDKTSYRMKKRGQMTSHQTGNITQIARFTGPTWGPPGSCQPQVGPHVGPMNLAIRGSQFHPTLTHWYLVTPNCYLETPQWRHRFGPKLACCLTPPSHYLNQCWLIIKCVLWHSPESTKNFQT